MSKRIARHPGLLRGCSMLQLDGKLYGCLHKRSNLFFFLSLSLSFLAQLGQACFGRRPTANGNALLPPWRGVQLVNYPIESQGRSASAELSFLPRHYRLQMSQ